MIRWRLPTNLSWFVPAKTAWLPAIRLRPIRLSREGILGLVLLVVCMVFYFAALRPTQHRADQLQVKLQSLRERMQDTANALRAGQGSPEAQLVAYYRFFPPQTSTPAWLDKIYKAARAENIELDRGEYRAQGEMAGKLVRYQITLPVHGSYLQVRKFLASVLTDVPVASLDSIRFERQKIGDGAVDAKIRLTLYLGQQP